VKKIKKGEMKPFQLLRIKAEGEEMTRLEYYQQLILQFIKYFYLLLIGGLISFMIVHQALDYFATKREMSKRRTHL
jgi:hypothetical protein